MNTKKIIGIQAKTKYVNKLNEYRDHTPDWTSRLPYNSPTHFSPFSRCRRRLLQRESDTIKSTKRKEEIEIEKNILLVSGYDEWYGPIYACPFCAKEMIMDDFLFCPVCGGDLEGYGFETIKEDQVRMKKENE